MPDELVLKIQTLDELLADPALTIPPYQRPYTWREEQVAPLLNDLFQIKENAPVVMGSIILWKNGNKTEIVDGQQRLTTFSIFASLINGDQPNCLLDHRYAHTVSTGNIKANARFIADYIKKKGPENFHLTFGHICFIVLYVPTLADAFTFFDSQNTRGKKLKDSDILKAHHLRFIKKDDLAADCAKKWEWIQGDQRIGIDLLLETLIGRGRKFSRKEVSEVDIKKEFRSQRTTKTDAGLHSLNRYQQAPVFEKWEFDPMGKQELKLLFSNGEPLASKESLVITENAYQYLPFQITQSVEGGELFFWFTHKYYLLYKELFIWRNPKISDFLHDLLIVTGWFNFSTGTNYVHEVFTAALLFYFDKFGYEQIDEVAAHLFFSVYWLRFRQNSVQYASVFKYIRDPDGFNPFALIAQAGYPGHLVHHMDQFLGGKYRELWESQGIRRRIFNGLISHVEDGFFSLFEEMIPQTLLRTLKRPIQ